MKVIINTCYGGYGLSDEAVQAYAKAKGLTLYTEVGYQSLFRLYYLIPVKEYEALRDQEARNPVGPGRYRESNAACFDPAEIPRDDQTLVSVLESLGSEKCSDKFADLKVVEIPDGTDYEIQEYDGVEHIAEVHSTWY